MGDDILRKVFDVVICGTSLGACITAAAAASCTPVDDDALAAGQPSTAAQPSILHLDALGFYGTDAACLSLTQVEQAAAAQAAEAMAGDRFAAQFMDAPPSPADDAPSARDAELGAWSSLGAARTSSRWPVMFHTNAPLPAELESQRRRTVVDLLPTLTLARGAAIDTLISSKVAEYLEFVLLNGSYMVTSTDEAHTPVFHQVRPRTRARARIHKRRFCLAQTVVPHVLIPCRCRVAKRMCLPHP
ncbi:hypothetical protein EON62_02265 [archaeon]|nr:MAG: hypothetical protein EON62_02265 [archaeon]